MRYCISFNYTLPSGTGEMAEGIFGDSIHRSDNNLDLSRTMDSVMSFLKHAGYTQQALSVELSQQINKVNREYVKDYINYIECCAEEHKEKNIPVQDEVDSLVLFFLARNYGNKEVAKALLKTGKAIFSDKISAENISNRYLTR